VENKLKRVINLVDGGGGCGVKIKKCERDTTIYCWMLCCALSKSIKRKNQRKWL